MYYHTNVDIIKTYKLRMVYRICFIFVEVELARHGAVSKKFLGGGGGF